MKLKLNREFLLRHLFVVILLSGMGAWFAYDGYVRYPSMTAEQLYADAHKGAVAPDDGVAEKFQAMAIPRQKQFMFLALLAAGLVGVHLLCVAMLRFDFDESGFTCGGKRYFYGDIVKVDRSKWKKKGIVTLVLKERTIRLDAWHHSGVREFESKLGNR